MYSLTNVIPNVQESFLFGSSSSSREAEIFVKEKHLSNVQSEENFVLLLLEDFVAEDNAI